MSSYHLIKRATLGAVFRASQGPQNGSWIQRNIVDNPWLEGAAGLASFIPGVGGLANAGWEGMRGAYHTAQGNYGKAAEAAAWGAAGMIPGGAAVRGLKLGAGAIKGVRVGEGIAHGIQAVRAAEAAAPAAKGALGLVKRFGGSALDTVGAAGLGAALPNAPQIQPRPAPTFWNPGPQPQIGPGWIPQIPRTGPPPQNYGPPPGYWNQMRLGQPPQQPWGQYAQQSMQRGYQPGNNYGYY